MNPIHSPEMSFYFSFFGSLIKILNLIDFSNFDDTV